MDLYAIGKIHHMAFLWACRKILFPALVLLHLPSFFGGRLTGWRLRFPIVIGKNVFILLFGF